MINQAIMPKAYKEVYEIVKHLSEEDFNKIPKEIIKTLHSNMDKDYEFYINFEDLQNQETLNETKLLLAIIFRDYLATENKKKRLWQKKDMMNKFTKKKCEKSITQRISLKNSKAVWIKIKSKKKQM